jgi:alginate O-acetylation protein algI
MLFSSLIFITVFLPIVIFLYYTVFRFNRTLQNVFLFLASIGFYAWGEPKFVFVLLCSIFMNWVFGLLIDKFRDDKVKARIIIFAMLLANLSIIFVFKYLTFTLKNIEIIAHKNWNIPNIALPIGISFFTFQAISYVIDIYRKKGDMQKNPLNVGLYISFFPQLVAGPIVRYETVAKEIANRKENLKDFSDGANRFVIGLAKKVLIANNVALVADTAYTLLGYGKLSMSMAWLGAICYTLQIYYDFSGYSDMAIGLGRMFGFHFNENFNYPYISKSIGEFWRRWHISLGTWFRDYVYIPLGGSRVKTKSRLYLNLFVVWALTGIWHGANWTFICWGLMYFVLLAAEKSLNLDTGTKFGVLRHIYTLLFVVCGWVLFRAPSMAEAKAYLTTMFVPTANGIVNMDFLFQMREFGVFIALGILFAVPVFPKFEKSKFAASKMGQAVYIVGLMFLFLGVISYLVKGAYNPFIYFNF